MEQFGFNLYALLFCVCFACMRLTIQIRSSEMPVDVCDLGFLATLLLSCSWLFSDLGDSVLINGCFYGGVVVNSAEACSLC